MERIFKIPLQLTPQPEGGFTVTSPLLPELVTEGDTVGEALEHVQDALAAALEIYEDTGRALPEDLVPSPERTPIQFECLIAPR